MKLAVQSIAFFVFSDEGAEYSTRSHFGSMRNDEYEISLHLRLTTMS